MKNLRKENEIYEAPKCEVIEIQNEGVLCGSADAVELTGGAFGNQGTTSSFTAGEDIFNN